MKRKKLFGAVCLGAAVLVLEAGFCYNKKAGDFSHTVSITANSDAWNGGNQTAQESGFPLDEVRQIMEEAERAEEAERTENTEHTEDTEGTEEAERTENAERAEEAERTANTEHTEDTEGTEEAERTENAESAEDTGYAQNAQSILFAVWTETDGIYLSAEETGRTAQGNVIMLYGSSKAIIPCQKTLGTDNGAECLLGSGLAEKLFGSHSVEGQEIVYGGRTFTVRGILSGPEELCVCEMPAEEGATAQYWERLSFFAENQADGYRAAADFISLYGINGSLLRLDMHRNLSWMSELIPGKWSDFSGWKENFQEMEKKWEETGYTKLSCLEMAYLSYLRRRNFCICMGLGTLGVGIWQTVFPGKDDGDAAPVE